MSRAHSALACCSLLLLWASLCVTALEAGPVHQQYAATVAGLRAQGYQHVPSPFSDKTMYTKGTHSVVLQSEDKNAPKDLVDLIRLWDHRRMASGEPAEQSHTPDVYFRFIPEFQGALMMDSSLQWKGGCFQSTSVSASTNSSGHVNLAFDVQHPLTFTCGDLYLLATTTSFHIHEFLFSGHHTIEWKGLTDLEMQDIQKNGFRIFAFESGITETIVQVWETAQMFLGGLGTGKDAAVPQEMMDKNLKFLKEYVNITMEERPIEYVELNETDIHSGDFLGIIRLDGLDPMLAWGMGSHTGHTTAALWIDDELYVTESQDAWYWPGCSEGKCGIIKTPFRQWVKWAQDASYNVVVLPLSEKSRQIWDNDKAVEFFKKNAGYPYGYHNLFFGWIDTARDNFPPPLTGELLMIGFAIADKLIPSTIDRVWNEALNMRLGTKGLNTAEVYAEAEKRGMTFSDLVTIPEQDKWIYSDGPSWVCDVWVMELYKAAGLFGNMTDEIQGTEFTNWDVYSLNFFAGDYERPQQCREADPNLPYCQILGKYRMTLPGYNTVQPYPKMREHCPGLPVNYDKTPGC